jgi:YgiT-type zinc finger domain-containing protein
MASPSPSRCPQCMVGALTPARVFYCRWSDGHFITVPDFPAWVCDVCGAREYDAQAVLELQTLIEMSRPVMSPPPHHPATGKDEAGERASVPHRHHP